MTQERWHKASATWLAVGANCRALRKHVAGLGVFDLELCGHGVPLCCGGTRKGAAVFTARTAFGMMFFCVGDY